MQKIDLNPVRLSELTLPQMTSLIAKRNLVLESCALESFSFRLPYLLVSTHFYYKLVKEVPFEMGVHEHMHWEIARVPHGRNCYNLTESDIDLVPPSDKWLIIPPRMTHSWKMIKAPLVINSWHVKIEPDDSLGERILQKVADSLKDFGYLLDVSESELAVDEDLYQISGEAYPTPVAGTIFSGFARILITSLLSRLGAWQAIEQEKMANLVAPPRDAISERVKHFLEANLQNPISLADVEAQFNFSARHLNRLFKEQNGVSIGQYLRQRRMELGRRWLITSSRSIKDIALSLGYANSSQFCRYFLMQCGMSPTDYRQRYSEDAEELVKYSTSSDLSGKITNPFGQ